MAKTPEEDLEEALIREAMTALDYSRAFLLVNETRRAAAMHRIAVQLTAITRALEEFSGGFDNGKPEGGSALEPYKPPPR